MLNAEQIVAAVAGAKPWVPRAYIQPSRGILELKQYHVKKSTTGKVLLAADFVVVSCESLEPGGKAPHKPGDAVGQAWKMSNHAEEWQAERDKGRAQSFVTELLGPAFLGANPTIDVIVKKTNSLIGAGQPGRGMWVRYEAHRSGPKFVEVTFQTYVGSDGKQIDAATVKANRTRQESGSPPTPPGVPKAPAQAAKTETPAPAETASPTPDDDLLAGL